VNGAGTGRVTDGIEKSLAKSARGRTRFYFSKVSQKRSVSLIERFDVFVSLFALFDVVLFAF